MHELLVESALRKGKRERDVRFWAPRWEDEGVTKCQDKWIVRGGRFWRADDMCFEIADRERESAGREGALDGEFVLWWFDLVIYIQ